jgi:hypothetical protein
MSAKGNAAKVDLGQIVECFDSSKSTFLTDVSSAVQA